MEDRDYNEVNSCVNDEFLAEFVPTHEVTHTIPSEWYWQKGRDYTKRFTSITTRIDRASERVLSLSAKYTYHLLQSSIGSRRELADIPGVLIKYGEPVSIGTLARDLGKQEDELREDIRQLIKFEIWRVVVFRFEGDEMVTLVDAGMYDDEVASLKENLRQRARGNDEDAKAKYDFLKRAEGRPTKNDQENRLVKRKLGKPGFKPATEQNGTERNVNGTEGNVNGNRNNKSNAPLSSPSASHGDATSLANDGKQAGSVPPSEEPTKATGSVTAEPKPTPAEPSKLKISPSEFAREHNAELRMMPWIDIRDNYGEAERWLREKFPQYELNVRGHLGHALDEGLVAFDAPVGWSDASWIAGVDTILTADAEKFRELPANTEMSDARKFIGTICSGIFDWPTVFHHGLKIGTVVQDDETGNLSGLPNAA